MIVFPPAGTEKASSFDELGVCRSPLSLREQRAASQDSHDYDSHVPRDDDDVELHGLGCRLTY